MVSQIVKDIFFLRQKSEPAVPADIKIAQDLLDTLEAHRDGCVGMAANMIGKKKNIIVVNIGFKNVIMFNPVIVNKSGLYRTEEGCLSLTGVRETNRYETIEVEYTDISWKPKKSKFSGWTAQIIQHEIDHLHGIII